MRRFSLAAQLRPGLVRSPRPLILSRVAQSGFLREPEHPIFYAASLLDHWERAGAQVLNGAEVLAIDSFKARQLSVIASLGLAVPKRRVVHRAKDLAAAAEGFAYPLMVKANIGGSGRRNRRYSSRDELLTSIEQGTVPSSVEASAGPGLYPGAWRDNHAYRNARRAVPLRDRGRDRRRHVRPAAPPTRASPSRAAKRRA